MIHHKCYFVRGRLDGKKFQSKKLYDLRWDKHACWQIQTETIQGSCNPKGSQPKTHKRLLLDVRTKYHSSETWISLKPCFSLQQEPVQQLLKMVVSTFISTFGPSSSKCVHTNDFQTVFSSCSVFFCLHHFFFFLNHILNI